jgi:hypothetical protein
MLHSKLRQEEESRVVEEQKHYDPKTAPIIFVNIGWMKYYRGNTKDDQLDGANFKYLRTGGRKASDGHEQWNFKPFHGRLFAYVPRSAAPDLKNLGAQRSEDRVSGALVVFMSRSPFRDTRVVGWYHNATVTRGNKTSHQRSGKTVSSAISADASSGFVIPTPQRTIVVPTNRQRVGGYGQSPIWYGIPAIVAQVRAAAAGQLQRGALPASRRVKPSSTQSGPGRQQDPELRRKVEAAAMQAALAIFGGRSVEREHCGWDITVDGGPEGEVYIEVKGTAGRDVFFELTPNELEKMNEHTSRYVIFVLTSALTKKPMPHVFHYDGAQKWKSDRGGPLKVSKRTGAQCSWSAEA